MPEGKLFHELQIGKVGFEGLALHVLVPNTKQTNVMLVRMHEVSSIESQLLSMSQI